MKKHVHVLQDAVHSGLLQHLWLDREGARVRPNVCIVDPEGNVLLQTNGLGLRGADVEEGQRIGVVWGDSVVWGILGSSWPEKMNDHLSGCVFLNGGIEGFEYDVVLRRALRFNARHDVAVNVILPGWHRVGDNVRFRADLVDASMRLPNVLVATMPTSLNPNIVTTDISAHFTNTRPTYRDLHQEQFFGFFGAEPYSLDFQTQLFQHICARNDLIRDVAKELALPIVDLFQLLDSSGLSTFNEHFFDTSHPRPRAHSLIAKIVAQAAEPLIANTAQIRRSANSHEARFITLQAHSEDAVDPKPGPQMRLERHRPAKNVFAPKPKTHNAGKVSPDARGRVWNVCVPGPQWSYAASWPRVGDIPDGGPLVVEIDVTVDEGIVGFALVAADESFVGKEATVAVSAQPVTVILKAEESWRIRYLVLRNVDDTGATAAVRISEIRAYTGRLVTVPLCVLYQPEKTGSQTVESSIAASDEEAIVERHHFLSRQTLNKFDDLFETCWEGGLEMDSYRNQARLSRRAAGLLDKHEPSSTFIFTGIRDPLERALSAFFQHLAFLCPDLTFASERIQHESVEIISRFTAEFDSFIKRRNSKTSTSELRNFLLDRTMQNLDDWMRDELSAVFELNVSRIHVPRKEFAKFQHKKRTFLIYKVERLAEDLPIMLKSLPLWGTPTIVNRNLGEDKEYAALYQRTRADFTATQSMMNYYYEHSTFFSRAFKGQRPAFAPSSTV